MKNLLKLFVAVALVGGIVGCESKQPCPECPDSVATIKSDTLKLETINPDTSILIPLADAKGFAPAATFGKLSTSPDEDGANICVLYDGLEVYFHVITVSGKKLSWSNGIPLSIENGVEVWLEGPDLKVNAISGVKGYPAVDQGKNVRSVELAGDDELSFDVKISKASPTVNNDPGLIGVNDARTGSIAKSSGLVASLKGSLHVRINALKYPDGSGTDVIFSTKSEPVLKSKTFEFAKLGVPFWGCNLDVAH